jgi:hypothetical protein
MWTGPELGEASRPFTCLSSALVIDNCWIDWWVSALEFAYWHLPIPLVSTLSMFFLIVWPLYVLWGVDLPPKERRLILILFASTIFMAPFVGAHAAYSYSLDETVEACFFGMTAHIEVAFSYASPLEQH